MIQNEIRGLHASSTQSVNGVISERWVKQTLDGMVYGRSARMPNPLEHLTIIDEMLADPAFPACFHQRMIALGDLLTRIIEQELLTHRRMMGLATELSETALTHPLHSIANDACAANRELLGWSWLYYRYVRVELGIQAEAFCQISHIDERTLRRYRARVITRLTDLLIEQEWRARRLQYAMNSSLGTRT